MLYPKVSIIIPTFNRAAMLPSAIDSALAQDYPNLEVVVSDNASTDETPAVVDRYKSDSRLRYFRNSSNLGLAGNWAKALREYVSGTWALILSDDDMLIDREYVGAAVDLATHYPGVVLVHANYEVRRDSQTVSVSRLQVATRTSGLVYWRNYRSSRCPHIHSTMTSLFSREIALSGYPDMGAGPIGVDTLLWLRLMLHGDVGFLANVAAVYRLHTNNTVLSTDVDGDIVYQTELAKIADEAFELGISQAETRQWLQSQVAAVVAWRAFQYWRSGDRRASLTLLGETRRFGYSATSRTVSALLMNLGRSTLYHVSRARSRDVRSSGSGTQ